MRRGREQAPAPSGRRKSRWAVIRQTYRELADTTLKTWLEWFPEEYLGAFHYGDMAHYINKGDLEMEVLFRALERPEDIKKLLSLDLTGAWVNEAREMPKAIIDALGDRVGRYPSIREGGCTWRGIVMDTNSPDTDHWWYKLAEEETPEDWAFFAQPGGLIKVGSKWVVNPIAENLENLEGAKDKPPRLGRYYEARAAGKTEDHIKVYYGNIYGFVRDGKPVYPDYNDAVHCSPTDLVPVPGRTIQVGLDFGLTPAALFAQQLAGGRWIWFDELIGTDIGAVKFCQELNRKIKRDYPGFKFNFTGDPTGDTRSQADDEVTVFSVYRANGIPVLPASTNSPIIRIDAVSGCLCRMVNGLPGLLVAPKCKVARKGFQGGYHYRRVQIAGQERYHDEPVKDQYSHVHDAGQYALLGGGEDSSVIPLSPAWTQKLDYSKISKGVV